MKAAAPGRAAALLLAVSLGLAGAGPVAAQKVKIDRCTPSAIRAGQATEITLAGGGLEGCELWTSFPSRVERLDEKEPRFRITTDFVGPGAIRAHSNEGISNLCFVEAGGEAHQIIPCEKRTRREDAQAIDVPAVIEGSSAHLEAHHYRFTAKAGEPLVIHAVARGSGFDGVVTLRSAESGKRLAQADDSEVYGADPWLRFAAPADGDYLIELIDSQYRGGQAYRLRVGHPERRQDPPGLGTEEAFARKYEEEQEEPVDLTGYRVVYGHFETAEDSDTFSFRLPARRFVRITPTARSLRSPVTPRLRLTRAGQVIAETPADVFEERPLHHWLEAGEDYHLSIRDAFGRHGSDCTYRLEVNTEAPPFELGIPGQPDKKHPLHDKFVAVPGGLFVVPVQCRRHQFDPAVNLHVESSWGGRGESARIAEKQGNANLRVRLPGDAEPGDLMHLWITGSAELDGREFESPLRTRGVLEERDRGATIPENVDGALAVRVVELPVTVAVTPPAEVARGEAAKVPVKLGWHDEKRRFNTTLNLTGLPGGVHTSEKKLNAKDITTGLELKAESPETSELKNLRVEVRLEYHGQPLLVESEPFTIRIVEKDETKN